MVALFAFFWVLVWLRAAYLQIFIGPELRDLAYGQYHMTTLVEAERGVIYDRNGQILARSVETFSVYANPKEIKDPLTTAKVLAKILSIDEKSLAEKLSNKKRSFVWVKRKIDDATTEKIRSSKLFGVGLSSEYKRVYPFKHLAGQLIGFVGLDNTGLEGLERSFNTHLSGTSQKYVVPRNIAGRALYHADDKDTQGKDLHLSLDMQIQFIAEEVISEAVKEHHARWGGVIIAEAETGHILAWAQYPFFNPNNFREYTPSEYRNRLANDSLEPGSTFKPLVLAAALQSKTITTKDMFYCENGTWQVNNVSIGDDGRKYKDLTPEEILAYSSNIGMAKISEKMGAKSLHQYLVDLGFGQKTGIGVSEAKGILRKPEDWGKVDILSTGFGQSLSATGIQMINAYNVLVNDGKKIKLSLIKEETTDNISKDFVFSKKVSEEVLTMMETVVDGYGTGKRARISGVRVAGKTGTAQKASQDSKALGYGDGRMASFMGILPAEKPKYIILAMLDEPQKNVYGGLLAAPVFQKVASRTMAYSGELPAVVFAENSIEETSKTNKEKAINLEQGIMPDLRNISLKKAMDICVQAGINPRIYGQGVKVLEQYPAPGTKLKQEIVSSAKQNADDKASLEKTDKKTSSTKEEKKIKNTYKKVILYVSLPETKIRSIEEKTKANQVKVKSSQQNTVKESSL